jgi:hypothetical protein
MLIAPTKREARIISTLIESRQRCGPGQDNGLRKPLLRSACFSPSSAVWRARLAAVPYAVGLYITSAYWFTASTSSANPAVTLARALSDTCASIAPAGVQAIVAAQFVGALAAVTVGAWLWPTAIKGKHIVSAP